MTIARPDAVRHRGRSPASAVRTPWVVVPMLALLALLVAVLPPEMKDIAGPIGLALGHLVAGVLMTRNARIYDGRERFAWTLVGTGFLVAASGVVVVATIGIINGSAPAFGPTDLIFVASYVAILVGFALLPHVTGSITQRLRIFLDGLVGAISIAVVLWVLLLRDLLIELADAPTWERLIASTYPLLDVATLIVVMIVTARRSSLRFDVRMVFFGAALIAQALADMTFFVTGVGKTFEEANPNYSFYLIAAIGFVVAAILLPRQPKAREYADRNVPWWTMVAPYAAALALTGLAVADLSFDVAGDDHLLILAVVLVGLLVIGRQGVAIRENRILVERQRESLVSSISHELRTPLTSMVGFLEILTIDPDLPAEERAEMIEIAHHQATYMARIVDDVLLLARQGIDDVPLDEKPHSLAAIIGASVESVELSGVDLEVTVASGLHAHVDGDRMQQVLVNLLSNAARYGHGRVWVAAKADGDDIVIEVHDDGPGVPKKYELRIWERFERGPHRLNAQVPGSGIGLAVVELIARAHGGEAAYARSGLLGGACFSVRLPDRAVIRPALVPDGAGRQAIAS